MPRTQIIEKEIYTFDELDEDAKERARDWYRGCMDSSDLSCVIDDFVTIAEIIGITFDTHQVSLMSGKTRAEPNIYWSGFCQQGSGACFEGSYQHNGDSCAKIREHCSDPELLRVTDELNAIQAAQILLGQPTLQCDIQHTGRYYHENSVTIDVVMGTRGEWNAPDGADEAIEELMRDLMRWLYRSLEAENDYLYSAESVDENIEANEYEFTEDGEIA